MPDGSNRQQTTLLASDRKSESSLSKEGDDDIHIHDDDANDDREHATIA